MLRVNPATGDVQLTTPILRKGRGKEHGWLTYPEGLKHLVSEKWSQNLGLRSPMKNRIKRKYYLVNLSLSVYGIAWTLQLVMRQLRVSFSWQKRRMLDESCLG